MFALIYSSRLIVYQLAFTTFRRYRVMYVCLITGGGVGALKMLDVKQTDEISGHEIAGHENAKHENVLAYIT